MRHARLSNRLPSAAPALTLLLALLGMATGCRIEEHERTRQATAGIDAQPDAFLGLRSAIYSVPDLDRAKGWYAELLNEQPYFDEPYYVGFDVSGYELGLLPDTVRDSVVAETVTAYWGVLDIESEFARLQALGARTHSPISEVGTGVRLATLLDPFGNIIGIIENPNFQER